MKKKLIIILFIILLSGCQSTDNQVTVSDKERYLKALKILFQAGDPISIDALVEIEYQKYLKEVEIEK